MCNLSIESIYISHFRCPKSHFHISCENEPYLQEVEKLFSHQYFDLIVISWNEQRCKYFVKRAPHYVLPWFWKFSCFSWSRVRESLFPYSGDILNICGNNFPETSVEAYLFTLSSVNFLKTSLTKCLLTVLHDISVNTQTKWRLTIYVFQRFSSQNRGSIN